MEPEIYRNFVNYESIKSNLGIGLKTSVCFTITKFILYLVKKTYHDLSHLYSIFLYFLKYSITKRSLNFYKKYFCLSYLKTMLPNHLYIYWKPINKRNIKSLFLLLIFLVEPFLSPSFSH